MRKPKPTGKTWTRPGLAAGPGLEFWGRLRQEGQDAEVFPGQTV